jgi:hypothetical protein
MNITSYKKWAAGKVFARIRKTYNKKDGNFILKCEFYEFTGLKEECVNR